MKNKPHPKRIVFYADDDPDDLDFVRECFAEYAKDIELVTFRDGVELLEAIRSEQKDTPLPCLVILDINMPRLDGKEALKVLREIEGYKDVPAVLFTTSTSPHDAVFSDTYSAGFISKPLNERQMDVIVEKFLDHCNESAKK